MRAVQMIAALAAYYVALIGVVLALPGLLLQWAGWWLFFAASGEDAARRALRLQIAIEIPALDLARPRYAPETGATGVNGSRISGAQ